MKDVLTQNPTEVSFMCLVLPFVSSKRTKGAVKMNSSRTFVSILFCLFLAKLKPESDSINIVCLFVSRVSWEIYLEQVSCETAPETTFH